MPTHDQRTHSLGFRVTKSLYHQLGSATSMETLASPSQSLLSGPNSSSSTIPGIGSIGGKLIKSLGKFVIRLGTRAEVKYALRGLQELFPHGEQAPSQALEEAYDTLLDLTRSDAFPLPTCRLALSLVYSQILTGHIGILVNRIVQLDGLYVIDLLAGIADEDRRSKEAQGSTRGVTWEYLDLLYGIAEHSYMDRDEIVAAGVAYVLSYPDLANSLNTGIHQHPMYALIVKHMSGTNLSPLHAAYHLNTANTTSSASLCVSSSTQPSMADLSLYTTSTSSTVPGLGSIGGRVVKSIGVFALEFGSKVTYGTLLDITRNDPIKHPSRTRRLALSRAYGQIAEGHPEQLIPYVVKWSPRHTSQFLLDIAEEEHRARQLAKPNAARSITSEYLYFVQSIAGISREYYEVAITACAVYVASCSATSRFCWHRMYILGAMRLAEVDIHSQRVDVRYRWLLQGPQSVVARLDTIGDLLKEICSDGLAIDTASAAGLRSGVDVEDLVADLIEFYRPRYKQAHATVPRVAYELLLQAIVIGKTFWSALAAQLASSREARCSVLKSIISDSTTGDPFLESGYSHLTGTDALYPKDIFLEFLLFFVDKYPDLRTEALEWDVGTFLSENISAIQARTTLPERRELWEKADAFFAQQQPVWDAGRFPPVELTEDSSSVHAAHPTLEVYVRVSTDIMED